MWRRELFEEELLVKVCVGIEGSSSFPSGWWGTVVQGECRRQAESKVLCMSF